MFPPPPFMQSGKTLIIITRLIPNQFTSVKRNSSRNLNSPRNLGKTTPCPTTCPSSREPMDNWPHTFPHQHPCRVSIKTRASSVISLSQPSGNLSLQLSGLEIPENKPTRLQSPSTTIKAGGSIRFCNFRSGN